MQQSGDIQAFSPQNHEKGKQPCSESRKIKQQSYASVYSYLEEARPLQPQTRKELVSCFHFVVQAAQGINEQQNQIIEQLQIQNQQSQAIIQNENNSQQMMPSILKQQDKQLQAIHEENQKKGIKKQKNNNYINQINTDNVRQTLSGNSLSIDNNWLLENIPTDRNSGIHQIGNSLKHLFSKPVYQSYQQLVLSQDNFTFSTISLDITDKINTTLKLCQIQLTDKSLLKFESKFQSGNLGLASVNSSNPNQYFLALQRDTNSKATCQWYYFYVQNGQNLGQYTFSMVNLTKRYSAYQNGMRPCVLSVNDSKKNKTGWTRGGYNIAYKQNSIFYQNNRKYYTFQFTYQFTTPNDKVYFAYSFPYTFTRLHNFLHQKQTQNPNIMKSKTIAKTIGGNPIQLITITSSDKENTQNQKKQKCEKQGSDQNYQLQQRKDIILISARVHPGQTVSSFVCQGLINFLLSDKQEAQQIRKLYSIKIIPFLNPDGVVHGNYRTSLAGVDLNRKWKKPIKQLHPEIYAAKKYLYQTQCTKALYIDLHGHSKKRSSFMYGCLNKDNPYLCKEFPFFLSKNGYQFTYFNCNFSTPVSKQGTSRMNIWRQFKVSNSYTMEMSFCGPSKAKRQYSIKDYLKMGWSLGKATSVYFCSKKNKNLGDGKPHPHLEQFYSSPKNLNHGQQDSEGSDSGEEEQLQNQQNLGKVGPTSSVKQLKRQVKYFLPKYLPSDKRPIIIDNTNFTARNKKNEQRNTPSLKNRKDFISSQVNMQKIDIGSQYQIFNPTIKFLHREASYSMPKTTISKQTNPRSAYRPYSYTKYKKAERSSLKQLQLGKNQDRTLVLPKVVRGQQQKYNRYRKQEISLDLFLNQPSNFISVLHAENRNTRNQFSSQNSLNSRQIRSQQYQDHHQSSKQITLEDKINLGRVIPGRARALWKKK